MNNKPICPDGDDCEDIEKSHFRQLLHPHLDEVLKGRLEEDVTFHHVLKFKPKVRFLRYDQLVVLQKVLLEEQAASNCDELTTSTQHSNSVVQNVGRIQKIDHRNVRTLNVNKAIVEKNLATSSTTSSMPQYSIDNNNSVSKLNFKNLVASPTTSSMLPSSSINNNLVTKQHVKTPVVNKNTSPMQQSSTINNNLVIKQYVKTPVANKNTSAMQQSSTVNNNFVSKLNFKTLVANTTTSPVQQNSTCNNNSVTMQYVKKPVTNKSTSLMQQNPTINKNSATKPHVNTPVATNTANLNNKNLITNNSTSLTSNIKPIVSTPSVHNKLRQVPNYRVTSNNIPNNNPSVSKLSNHSNVINNKTRFMTNPCAQKIYISSADSCYIINKNELAIHTATINNKLTSQENKFQNKPTNSQISKHVNNNMPMTALPNKQFTIQNKKSLGSPISTIKSASHNSPVNSSNKKPTQTTFTTTNKQPLGSSTITTSIDSASYNTPVSFLNDQPTPSTSSLTYKVNEKPLDLPILTDNDFPIKTFNNSTKKSINSIENNLTIISPTSNKRQSNSLTDFESKKFKQDTNNNSVTEDNYLDCLLRKFDDCSTQNDRENIRLEAINQMSYFGSSILNLQSPGKFIDKYNNSSPYYLFYSSIHNNQNTWIKKNSITFPEILDLSLGQIQSSFHITSLVNTKWLRQQYLLAAQKNDCFIIYDEIDNYDEIPENIKTLKIKLPTGKHNSKISILNYGNGARVVVMTGSLNQHDWLNHSQGVWISPNLPYLPAGTNPSVGESKTGFKADFMNYLRSYQNKKIESLLKLIVKLDFSCVDVFFISSVPGNFIYGVNNRWGANKVSKLLKNHSAKINANTICPVIAQTSVANNLKSIENDWFHQEIIPKLTNELMAQIIIPTPLFKIIYPTINNYKNSFDAENDVNSSSFYELNVDDEQEWLKAYMSQWISTDKQANDAMPSINSYTKLSSGLNEIPWFILTSHSLSKDAWGFCKNPNDSTTTILNYEAGIIFFPKFMISRDTFPLVEPNESGTPAFTLPYKFPLTPYGPDDKPYVRDYQ